MKELFTIRPLVWGQLRDNSWSADSIGGAYYVWLCDWGDGRWRWSCQTGGYSDCTSLADGKAQAEAHYRERLMQALKPAGEQP